MRIQLLDRTDLSGIVESDVGQGEVATALYADWSASVEAADAGDVPSRGNPARAEAVRKRKIPVVAQHQVMPQVEASKVHRRAADRVDRTWQTRLSSEWA